MEHRKALYTSLLLKGTLWSHLTEIDQAANEQMDSLTAAHQALMWYITGNEQYRRNVFAILDNFALVESAVDHTDFRFGDVV